MKRSLMTKYNFILVLIGIFLIYFSFYLMSFITTNYDGPYAFITIFMCICGILTIGIGLSIDFVGKKG